jgi:hypothetical protein
VGDDGSAEPVVFLAAGGSVLVAVDRVGQWRTWNVESLTLLASGRLPVESQPVAGSLIAGGASLTLATADGSLHLFSLRGGTGSLSLVRSTPPTVGAHHCCSNEHLLVHGPAGGARLQLVDRQGVQEYVVPRTFSVCGADATKLVAASPGQVHLVPTVAGEDGASPSWVSLNLPGAAAATCLALTDTSILVGHADGTCSLVTVAP